MVTSKISISEFKDSVKNYKAQFTFSKVKNKRDVAVIEDIGYIINTFLDEQHNGNIPF